MDETFDHDHRVVNTRGSSEGRFTFSAADSGEHRICFTPSHVTGSGRLSNGQVVGGVKLTLDLATGETSQIESKDKGKISDMVTKLKDINARLVDIRREQVFQRVSPPGPLPFSTDGIARQDTQPDPGEYTMRLIKPPSAATCSIIIGTRS